MYRPKQGNQAKRLRKYISDFFIILCISCMFPTTISLAANDINADDMPATGTFTDATRPAITVLAMEDDGSPGEPLANDTRLKLGDQIYLRFDWEIVLESSGLNLNTYYELCALPSYLDTDATSVPIIQEGIGQFATLHVRETNGQKRVWIEFLRLNDIHDAHVAIGFHLADGGKPNNTEGKIELNLPGMKAAVTIVVTDYLPKGPSLEKTAKAIDDSGQVGWTITYTPAEEGYAANNGSGAIPDAVRLEDTLPEGMEYVADSAMVNGTQIMDSSIAYDADSHTLSYTIAPDIQAGAPIALTYETRLNNAAVYELWTNPQKLDFTNAAWGIDEWGQTIPELSASHTVTVSKDWADGHAALNKTGTYSFDGVSRRAAWTITVNTVSRNFEYLQVIDTLGKGLTLNPAAIKVNGNAAAADCYTVSTNADGTTTLTLSLYENSAAKISPNADGSYTITYDTTVSDDYFWQTADSNGELLITDDDVKNQAKLQWKWATGTQPGDLPAEPSIEKPPLTPSGLTSNVLGKTGISYDRAARLLAWNVTVNSNQVDIQSAVWKDQLREDGILTRDAAQYFLELAYEDEKELADAIRAALPAGKQNIVSNVTFIKSSDGNRNIGFTFDLGALGETNFTFPVQARMLTPSFWAANQGNLYAYNDVEMSRVTVGSNQLSQTFRSSGTVTLSSDMLKKAHTSYDPATKELTWTLTINTNMVDGLGAVTVTDTLPKGLTYVANSTTFNNTELSDNSIVTVDESKNQIIWTLSEENGCNVNGAKVLLTFKTMVDLNMMDDDGKEIFLAADEVSLTNMATLKSTAYDQDMPSVRSTAKLNNPVLGKSVPVKDSGSNKLTYTATLNPLGMKLRSGESTPLYLEDRMPAGLVPDLDSIRLYKAVVTAAKTAEQYSPAMAKGEDVTPASADIVYKTEAAEDGTVENIFRVPVEDETPYILEYDAYALQTNVELTNEIRLVGSTLAQDAGQSRKTSSYIMRAFGGTSMQFPKGNWMLRIKKVDGNQNPITFTEEQMNTGSTPAIFGLYTDTREDAKLLEAVCDGATGMCTFSQPVSVLDGATTLYLREQSAPTDYVTNDEWRPLDTEQLEKLKNKETVDMGIINVQSGSFTGEIKVLKSYEGESPETQATFALYDDSACNEADKIAESVLASDGTYTFTGLYPGKTYYLKETETPAGYVTSPVCKVAAGTQAGIPTEVSVMNETPKASLQVNKVAAWDQNLPLAGAKFSLYSDEACTQNVGNGATDDQGILLFTGLCPDTTYWLKETKAPTGYVLANTVYSVTTGTDNTDVQPVTIAVFNTLDSDESDNSGNPGASDSPDSSDNPDESDSPGSPGNPAASDSPDSSDTPDESGSPGSPGNPGASDSPDSSDNPDESGSPDSPGNPEASDNAGMSGNSQDSGDSNVLVESSIPQTGDDWGMVPALAGLSTILLAVGGFWGKFHDRRRE